MEGLETDYRLHYLTLFGRMFGPFDGTQLSLKRGVRMEGTKAPKLDLIAPKLPV